MALFAFSVRTNVLAFHGHDTKYSLSVIVAWPCATYTHVQWQSPGLSGQLEGVRLV